MAEEPTVAYNESISHAVPVSDMSTREKLIANTMSVDEYFDELIDQVRHVDEETMSIEDAREMTQRAVDREYALERDMTVEELYAFIVKDIEEIYSK